MELPFLDIHSHRAQAISPQSISVQSLSLNSFTQLQENHCYSLGFHPYEQDLQRLEESFYKLETLAQDAKVWMIGECGLDKTKGLALAQQMVIFEQQIHLAERLKKPLIIHCVRAFEALIEMKASLKVQVPMIIHGFRKHPQLAQQLLAQGFLLSFGAAALQSDHAAELLNISDDFFLETDDLQIPISDLYAQAAFLKKIQIDDMKARIFANWKNLNLI